MATKLYPPLIDGSLPAFYKRYDTAGKVDKAEITVPFEINRTVSITDIYKIRMRIRTIATNTELVNIDSTSVDLDNHIAKFILNKSQASKFNEGQFYMVQIAFVQAFTNEFGRIDNTQVGYFSNLGTIKCVAKPQLTIVGFSSETANRFEQEIIGEYIQDTNFGDSTEKVNTYQFQIWDSDGNIVLESGEQLHNSSEDVYNYKSQDRFITSHLLQEGILYYIQYSVTTINKLILSSPTYLIMQSESVDIEASVKFHGEASFEEGYVKLWLQGEMVGESLHEQIVTGTFRITRASDRDNYFTWDEILRFNLTGGYPSDYIFRDFTVEQGVPYRYRIQQYNIHDVFSNPIYLTYSLDDEKAGLGKCGEEKIIIPDFEDMFLYDGERQLKIRFNPKVSSFKNTIPEQKIETIGSKYPFIFRNGQVCYKEFPIAGLLTFQSDNTISFFNMEEAEIAGILTPIYGRGRTNTSTPMEMFNDSSGHFVGEKHSTIVEYPAGAVIRKDHEYAWVPGSGYEDKEYVEVRQNKDLTSENIMGERYFKLKVLDWLSNGEIKLFRSPTEGNYLVRLLNVSMTPQDALGRMIHQFTCTAYEIADLTYDNLVYYKLVKQSMVNLMERQWASVDLNLVLKNVSPHLNEDDETDPNNGWYPVELDSIVIDRIEFSDFSPNDKIRIKFDTSSDDEWEYIIIGQTGGYDYQSSDRYIVGIEFLPAPDAAPLEFSRIVTYTYEGVQVRKFDAISDISTQVQVMLPFIGPIDNLLEQFPLYERRQISNGYNYIMVDKESEDNDPFDAYFIKTNRGYEQVPVGLVDHYLSISEYNYYAYGENLKLSLYTDLGDIENGIPPTIEENIPNTSDVLEYHQYIFGDHEPSLIYLKNSDGEFIEAINDHDLFTYFIDGNTGTWIPKWGISDLWFNKTLIEITDSYVYNPSEDLVFVKDLHYGNQNYMVPIGVKQIIVEDLKDHSITTTYTWDNDDSNRKYYYLHKSEIIADIENDSSISESDKMGRIQFIDELFANSLKSSTQYDEIIGQYIDFAPNVTYYTRTENVYTKKVAKEPDDVYNAIPYTMNFNISPTLSKFQMAELDVLHVRKRDVVPIYALSGTIRTSGSQVTFIPNENSSYCITPFFNGYVNQTIPYNLYDTLITDDNTGYSYYTIKVADNIQYDINKYIIALNKHDIDLVQNAATNISKHSILQIYRPILVKKNNPVGTASLEQQHAKNFNHTYIAIGWEPVPISTGFAYYDTNTHEFFEQNVDYEPYFAINTLDEDDQILHQSYVEVESLNTIQFTENHYTSAAGTNMISLRETEEVTLKHVGKPTYLHLGNGVMAELTCQMRVVDFLIESTVPAVAAAKAAYLRIKENYYDAISTYYNLYYSLQDANMNVDYYTQKIADLNAELKEYLIKVEEINELLSSTANPLVFKQQVLNSQNNLLLDIIDTFSQTDVYGMGVTRSFNSQTIASQLGVTVSDVEFVGLLKILGITSATYDPEFIQNQTARFIQDFSQRMKEAFVFVYNNVSKNPPTLSQFTSISNKIDSVIQYYEILAVNSQNHIVSLNTQSVSYWPFTLLLEKKEISAADQPYWYCYPTKYGKNEILKDGEINRILLDSLFTDSTIYDNVIIQSQKTMFANARTLLANYAANTNNMTSDNFDTQWQAYKNAASTAIQNNWDKTLPYRVYKALDPSSMDVIIQDPGYLRTFALVVTILSNNLQLKYFESAGLSLNISDKILIDRTTAAINSAQLSAGTVASGIVAVADTFVSGLKSYATNVHNQVANGQRSAADARNELLSVFDDRAINNTVGLTYINEDLWLEPDDLIPGNNTEGFDISYNSTNMNIQQSHWADDASRRVDYTSLLDFITRMRLLLNLLDTEKKYPVQNENGTITYTYIPKENDTVTIEDLRIWLQSLLKDKLVKAYAYWHKAATVYLDEHDLEEITNDSLNLYFYTGADMHFKLRNNLTAYTREEVEAETMLVMNGYNFVFNNISLSGVSGNSLPTSGIDNKTVYFIKVTSANEYRGYKRVSNKWQLVCTIPANDINSLNSLNTSDQNYKLAIINNDRTTTNRQKDTLRAELNARISSENSINLSEYLSDYYLVRSWSINDPTNTTFKNLLSSITALIAVRQGAIYDTVYDHLGFFNNELWSSYIGTLTTKKDDLLLKFVQYVEDLIDYLTKQEGYNKQLAIYNTMAEDPTSAVYAYESIKTRLDAQQEVVNQWLAVKDSCELMLNTQAYGTDLQKKEELENTLSTANYRLSYETVLLNNIQRELDAFKLTTAYTQYLAEANKLEIAYKAVQVAYITLYGSTNAINNYGSDVYFSIQRENNMPVNIVGSAYEYANIEQEYSNMVETYLSLLVDMRDEYNEITSLGIASLIKYWDEVSDEINITIELNKLRDKLDVYEAKYNELKANIFEVSDMIKDFAALFKGAANMKEQLENLLKYYDGDPDTLETGLIQQIREEITKYETLEKNARDLIDKYGTTLTESIDEDTMRENLYHALAEFLVLVQHYYTTVIEERYGE